MLKIILGIDKNQNTKAATRERERTPEAAAIWIIAHEPAQVIHKQKETQAREEMKHLSMWINRKARKQKQLKGNRKAGNAEAGDQGKRNEKASKERRQKEKQRRARNENYKFKNR